MGFFKKKTDPISERSRVLAAQIAALEAQIQLLNAQQAYAAAQTQKHPRLRSTAIPRGPTVASPAAAAPAEGTEPVFEELDQHLLGEPPERIAPDHNHELGIRRFDWPTAWRRVVKQLRGPPSSNPKLVNYLAAGSLHGLRPLRYEKRIARNRVLFFSVLLALLILGFLKAFLRH